MKRSYIDDNVVAEVRTSPYKVEDLNDNIQIMVEMYTPPNKSYEKYIDFHHTLNPKYFYVLVRILSEKKKIWISDEEKEYFEVFAEQKVKKLIKKIPI